ncbi:hypothetical protein CN917_21230 [Bacillus thuringiensis]|uniref:tyrosine-type recombinase/integrase n=1 Tax=Bacillus cereus group TaxID=86661 RepID=UPI000BFD7626|nr:MULTISPECIES: tyrosine-type recombinase/integrase [Bacillus cereus group]MED2614691.1 tyrosine-type recombinase/integrase [Bacillus toyonensis]PGL18321.1 hypothetical protein CN917_21230 [Bacillus thuringiensis]
MLKNLDIYNKEFISKIGKNSYVEALSKVFFSQNKQIEFHETFNYFKEQGIIANDTFEEKTWLLIRKGKRITTISFDIHSFAIHSASLRFYALLELKQENSFPSIQGKISFIKQAILATEGFQGKDCYSKLESFLNTKNKASVFKFATSLAKYLIFIGYEEQDDLIILCKQFAYGHKNSVRSLANFKDVLTFDWIIHDFQEKWTDLEKEVYFPIILWWNITLIIPMRVKEFVLLSRKCAQKNNEKYILTIPRTKKHARKTNGIAIADKLTTNKQIYDLIQDYISITKENSNSEYLLSYYHYCKSDWHKKNNGTAFKIKKNQTIFEEEQLYTLLKNFYKEIVTQKYGLSLQYIKPLDTRHFAFCNMMFQGFNMLTIARIGGHSSLDSQMHYFNHLEYFSQSSIQYLSDQYKKMPHVSLHEEGITNDSNIKKLFSKSVLNQLPKAELEKLPRMEYGYCLHTPKDCPVGDCRYCEHFFIPQNEFNLELYKWLSDESEILWRRFKEQLLLFQSITKNMNYNFITLEYDELSQAELNYISRNFKKLQEQKARVDAQLDTVTDFLFGGINDEK